MVIAYLLSQDEFHSEVTRIANEVIAGKMKQQEENILCSQKEAAHQLGVTTVTVRSYVGKGLLKEHRLSQRKPRYRQADIDDALKNVQK